MIDYNPHSWRSHLFDIHGSMVRDILTRVLLSTMWAGLVLVAHRYWQGADGAGLAVPSVGHALLGTAIGLLLVFRTNSAYDRFWEGRKLWGGIVNESRNLGRTVTTVLASDPELVRRAIGWAMALPWACAQHLLGRRGLGTAGANLPADEVEAVLEANHVPTAVGCRITQTLLEAKRQGLISDIEWQYIDQNVQLMIDYVGGCERIRNTRIPYVYMVHLRRALLLYHLTLPFALIKDFGLLMPAVVFLVSYLMYGIEEIGVEIEDPFEGGPNDLPIEQYAARIEATLRDLLPTASDAPLHGDVLSPRT